MKITTNQELVLKRPGDGSSIELAKRPRGRPPGSKNKPKPPLIITQQPPADPTPSMRAHILDIQSGQDIINSLAKFSGRNGLGLSVLSVSGAVTNLTLRQPPQESLVRFEGRFEMLSLAMTVMPPPAGVEGRLEAVAVAVAGVQGRVLGGLVVGPLVAAGTVTVVAAVFENAAVHRLPEEEEKEVAGEGEEEKEEERHCVDHEDTMYGSHFLPEVVWAPMARPPQPPPPY